MEDVFATPEGRVRLLSPGEIRRQAIWPRAFARNAKDHRFYEILDETLHGQFEFHYLLIEDAQGSSVGVQPCFVLNQDVLAASPVWLRKFLPNGLRLRMLMAGCAAGEGRLGAAEARDEAPLARVIAAALPKIAKRFRARLVVWKDSPAEDREIVTPAAAMNGFQRVASMPATRLPLTFSSFDDYLRRAVSHASRKDLRRKFRATAGEQLEMSVLTSPTTAQVEELLPLYEQVRDRSPLQFERLTRETFLALGERMADRVRFFVWRHAGRAVAFSLCLVHDATLYDEYLGLDYSAALDLHLYFVTFRDLVTWAIGQGLKCYRSTPLNYEPKRRLGFTLVPLDLHVRTTSSLLQPMLQFAAPWMSPTRAEPVLVQFPNAAEL